MKRLLISSCFVIAALSLASSYAQPRSVQFQSLTPQRGAAAAPTSNWISHFNNMSEAERQRRVHTFGMPPAPPNRWRQPQASATPPAAAPARISSNGLPISVYQSQGRRSPATAAASAPAPTAAPRAQVVAPPPRRIESPRPTSTLTPRVTPRQPSPSTSSIRKPVTPMIPAIAETPPPMRSNTPSRLKRTAPHRSHAPSLSRPSAASQSATPALRKLSLAHLFARKPARSSVAPPAAVPVVYQAQPSPVIKPKAASPAKTESPDQAAIRRQLAFTPNTQQGRKATPWGPYPNRKSYQRAVSEAQWKPRGPLAERVKQQQTAAKPRKKSWNLLSIFKRDDASPKATSRSSRASSSVPSGRSIKIPGSHFVTSGLPQAEPASGARIETTLFGG